MARWPPPQSTWASPTPSFVSSSSSGKSLAQIAKAQGKSTSGLEQAMTAALKQRLDKAVANKRITASQEQKLLSRLSSRIGDLINRTPPKGARRRGPTRRIGHRPRSSGMASVVGTLPGRLAQPPAAAARRLLPTAPAPAGPAA